MRHSFLPNQDQAVLKKRYRIRLTIVALLLLSVGGLIGTGSLFPTYITLSTEEKMQTSAITALKKEQGVQNTARLQNELKSDMEKIRVLSVPSTDANPSDIIERLLVARGQVRVTSIIINDISSTTAVVSMGGVAPTRESLVSFSTRLQSLSVGNKVELPISDFTKSKDIPFALKVTHILP